MNQKLSVLFVIKLNKKNQKGFCPLNVRITFNKKRKEFSSGLFANPTHWNAKKQVIHLKEPNAEYINAQILLIQQKINKGFLSLQLKSADFTIDDIYDCYLGKVIKKEDTVVHYFRSYLIYLSKLIDKDIKEATYKKFKYVCDDVEVFIKHKYNKKEINFSDSHYLIDLEEGMWEFEIRYHYRITDEGFLQLISFYEDDPGSVRSELKKTEASLKENLSNLLEQYIESNRFYVGFPNFIDSVLFTPHEYKALIEKIRALLEVQYKKAEQNRTPLIEYLARKELNPKPSGNNARSWIAKCPSGGSHFIMVTTDPDEWGCGYCKRKGGIKELQNWFNEKDQHKLTEFMKEINSGGIKSKKVMNWWRKRY